MSARKFAETIDMKYTTYYGYENGVSEPNSAVLVKLCGYFGCTADYLLGLVDEPSSHYEETEKSPASTEAETREITREMSIELLKALGLLDQSGNLSDDDLAFLAHIVGLLEWRFGDHS